MHKSQWRNEGLEAENETGLKEMHTVKIMFFECCKNATLRCHSLRGKQSFESEDERGWETSKC